MKPYYELSESDKHIILELIKKCAELDLGNVSFRYFTGPNRDENTFYISEYIGYWELVIAQRWNKTRDVYRILKEADSSITYDYSEKD